MSFMVMYGAWAGPPWMRLVDYVSTTIMERRGLLWWKLRSYEKDRTILKAMREQGASPLLDANIKYLEKEIGILSQSKSSYEVQIFQVCLTYQFLMFCYSVCHSQLLSDKFTVRENMYELLEYLWSVPSHLNAWRQIVESDMKLTIGNIGMLAFISEQIPVHFLLPEMVERVAILLNYFLLQLTSPQRRFPDVKDPEKYRYKCRHLLRFVSTMFI
ncbi:hypothetical protein ZIOFF_064020 [Zingiber officinale]|uniref:Ubiquitin conjugation factor E4 core domain-containing protein n=1 Tax=Zingiber officinale TaxID=94328 RepID=A0A8J5C8N0_ZINOF|nr:hypothetical protein ZIOFF_064020 [Zingiber officinale]